MFDLTIAVLIGFPFGFLSGYLWRDRISHRRQTKFRAEREARRPPIVARPANPLP